MTTTATQTKEMVQYSSALGQLSRMEMIQSAEKRETKKNLSTISKPLRLSPKTPSSKDQNDFLKVDVDSPKAARSCQQLSHALTMESSIKLLASPNFDNNQRGLEQLLLFIKMNKIISTPRTDVSNRIVFGGNDRTIDRVRHLLISFITDDIDLDAVAERDDDSAISKISDESIESTWEEESDRDHDTGAAGVRFEGALHGLSLQVIVSCLEHVIYTQSLKYGSKSVTIDFSSFFWKGVVQSLSKNIENENITDVTGSSLRCLRLLVGLDSHFLLPMLKYTMLPYIVNLQEFGESQNFQVINEEATKLVHCLFEQRKI